MNSLFGDTIEKNIDHKHENKTERCLENEYEEKVEEYHKMKSGG